MFPMIGHYGYYGFNLSYLLMVLPAILITLWAQVRVKSTFGKYSNQMTANRITGAQAARRVLESNGITGINIVKINGTLNDHYDPKTNTIYLSEAVCDKPSVAAVGVAAHEAGHAVQHAKGYALIKLRTAIVPVCNMGSRLAFPLLLIGMFLNFTNLILIGILLFSLAVFFQLVTVPVEYDASHRALVALRESGTLNDDELPSAKKTLSAAALTYVAALLLSAVQLLRFILMFRNRN